MTTNSFENRSRELKLTSMKTGAGTAPQKL